MPKIAHNTPLAGQPQITLPAVYGGSPNKPFLMRLSATGERPMQFAVDGLPQGLTVSENTVRGICEAGEYPLTVTAKNALGTDRKTVLLKIAPDGMLQTPLLGFTTWNAFESPVTQQDMTDTADLLVKLGLAEVGYCYVNLDSGWQKDYGGAYDAIQPNEKFPDMKAMYDHIHALGLKGGIYSTPMLQAWGCPQELPSIPGCTRGEADIRFADTNTGIGKEHLEANNVRQWMDWGIDYLKYDWAPTEPVNADIMKQELLRAPREVAMCTTVASDFMYRRYWQKNCCSWRDNADSHDVWSELVRQLNTVDKWQSVVCPGHFYDLDMLAIGAMFMNNGTSRLTDDEELFAFTTVAFFPSPIQLSMRLDALTDFEFDLITNRGILDINQDILCSYPTPVSCSDSLKIYRRSLSGDRTAYAVFNLSDAPVSGEIALDSPSALRDVWADADLGTRSAIPYSVAPHSAAVFLSGGCSRGCAGGKF